LIVTAGFLRYLTNKKQIIVISHLRIAWYHTFVTDLKMARF